MPFGKYLNKYRIQSSRKPDWDYRTKAIYFVTICTQNRLHYFGKIDNGKMELSEIGHIANTNWFDISKHFPFIELINFVVMPDHIHGLLEIHDNNDEIPVGTLHAVDTLHSSETLHPSETLHATSLQCSGKKPIYPETANKNEFMAKISPKRGSLSSVVRSYKSAVTKSAHEYKFEFAWQPRFHDHIVNGPDEFRRIYDYIEDNTKNWKEDKNYL